MARRPMAALASATMLLCGVLACAPSGGEAEAAGAAAEQALATIDHLVPRPDSVGPQPAKFAWTPVAGADSYAIGLVSEIDAIVWQTSAIPTAEVDWPTGLEVPAGTYFWIVEGFREGRRIAESGRAAFVVER